jgi:hypothetical protein
MDCNSSKRFRKRQLPTTEAETGSLSCPFDKRQRLVEHISTSEVASGNEFEEDMDILILDIDIFTIRELEEVLRN